MTSASGLILPASEASSTAWRHHSLTTNPHRAAIRSHWAYSASVSFVLTERTRNGFGCSFLISVETHATFSLPTSLSLLAANRINKFP